MRCSSDGRTRRAADQARDLAADREPAERLQRLEVREDQRPVADDGRVAAQRHGAADAPHGRGDVAPEQARAVVDVERVLAADAEGDRERDEVHVVELLAEPRRASDHPRHPEEERREDRQGAARVARRRQHDERDGTRARRATRGGRPSPSTGASRRRSSRGSPSGRRPRRGAARCPSPSRCGAGCARPRA